MSTESFEISVSYFTISFRFSFASDLFAPSTFVWICAAKGLTFQECESEWMDSVYDAERLNFSPLRLFSFVLAKNEFSAIYPWKAILLLDTSDRRPFSTILSGTPELQKWWLKEITQLTPYLKFAKTWNVVWSFNETFRLSMNIFVL